MDFKPETMMNIMFLVLLLEAIFLGTHALFRDRSGMSSFDGHYAEKGGNVYVWQEPPGNSKPVGLLFLAHGCSHSATDFWPKGEHCSNCIGLPVEKTIVAEALGRGYAVVAMSSGDRNQKCWHPAKDISGAEEVIEDMRLRMKVPLSSPNYLFGVSSGGFFVGVLGVHLNKLAEKKPELRVHSSVIQVSLLLNRFNSVANLEYMPNLLFVPMERDKESVERVEESVEKLKGYMELYKGGGKTKRSRPPRSKFQTIVAKPRVIKPDYFTIGAFLTPKESKDLVTALTKNGLVSANSGLLTKDPRRFSSEYAQVAKQALPEVYGDGGKDGLLPDHSPTTELLNMAYALHEITDEGLQEIFQLFASVR